MLRRRIIRSILLAPSVLCVIIWVVSYFRSPGVTYDARHGYLLGFERGAIVGVYLFNSHFHPRGWSYDSVPSDPAFFHHDYDSSAYRLMGFAYHFQTKPIVFSRFMIPLWCPLIGFIALLWYGWRRTRPAAKGTAFPVETSKVSD